MILQAITFILQCMTVVYYNIQQAWVITTVNEVNITIGSVILWYLCIAIIFSILIRLLGGIVSTWKETMK